MQTQLAEPPQTPGRAVFFKIVRSLFYGVCFGASFTSFADFFIERILLSSSAFLALLVQIDRCKSKKEAFCWGSLFGIAFFSTALFELYNAFKITGHTGLFLPCMVVLTSGLSLFISLPCVGAKFFRKKPLFLLFFCVFWVCGECLRAEVFPQLPAGLTLSLFSIDGSFWGIRFIQAAEIAGIYLLTLVWLLFLASFRTKRADCIAIAASFCVYILCYGQSVLSDMTLPTDRINIAILQPNISQKRKMDSAQRGAILRETVDFVRFVQEQASTPLDVIVLPESSIPGLIFEGAPEIAVIQAAIQKIGTVVIFGADRAENTESAESTEAPAQPATKHTKKQIVWHNSMYAVSKHKIWGIYDKVQLLPFGEYIPLRRLFPAFFNYLVGGLDCTPGPPQEIIIGDDDTFTFLPKICSESLFRYKVQNARWILAILNDAWFGPSLRAQHFAIDKLRVIQARRPMVRVANNGISAVLDICGRVTAGLTEDCREYKLITLDIGTTIKTPES
ncbi:MAG: apolipoprotein N-acyltransferase [Holosporales bacterium]|jgi:apolipoprotein N-acyltransferase|nr:apolipoprotein N-acyltransferase [Holosporales bacterium]